MEHAEQEQRRLDRFWGLDFEVARLSQEADVMRREEARSAKHRQLHTKLAEQLAWAHELKEREEAEHRARARHDVQERRKYLHAVYHENGANASQTVMDYRWSTRPAVPSLQTQHGASLRPPLAPGGSTTEPVVATLLVEARPGAAPESPSVHAGGCAGGRAIDRQYFPEEDDGAPLVVPVTQSTFPTSPKASHLLSKILDASNDHLHAVVGSGGSSASSSDATDGDGGSSGRHNDLIWGHPEYGWNQLAMLEMVFRQLAAVSPFAVQVDGEAMLRLEGGPASLGAVLADAFNRLGAASRACVSYTVVGSWVKKGHWAYFSDFCAPDAAFFAAADWLNVAVNCAAHEAGVGPNKLRTNRDHCRTVEADAKLAKRQQSRLLPAGHNQSSSVSTARESGGSSVHDAVFATAWRRHLDSRQRDASLIRDVAVGDMVWCQHGNGFRWLPAVVTNITVNVNSTANGVDDGVSYDLSYMVSHDAFLAAHEDSLSAAREVAKVAAGARPVREPADADRHLTQEFCAKALHLEGGATVDGAQLAARLAAAADDLQQPSLQKTVLGSAALSSLLLGTTLTSQAGKNSVVVLDKADWRDALAYAAQSGTHGSTFLQCASSYVLDVAAFNTA